MSSIVDVSERKVRPIYEAIEIANYKSALSQCNKLLKKQPEALILKALKALILERTGKAEEALQLCAQVKEKKPIDEAVLQAITMVYRSLGKNDEIVQIYEIAARLNPNNEELGNHWFMAIVRNNDFKGQQQAALKLHKVFKVNRYYFWAIMSSVLQAENAPASQSAIFLTLAERMMQKAVQEKRLKHTEEVHLYMIVLLTQNKIKEALEVLEGLKDDLAIKCGEDTEMIHIRNDLLLKTENWTKAIEASKLSLGTNSDDWRAYLTYLHSLFQLIELNKKDENGESLDKVPNLDDAREYLYSLQKKELESNDVKRGPFLAELELEKRIISEKKDSKPAKDMNTLVIEYARKFGDKSSCFEDLRPYLKDFSLETSKKFIEEYNASIDNTCEDKKSKIRNVQKNVNSYKLERYLGLLSDINENDAIAYVDKLWLLYKDALPYGSELLDTENQYSDEFVILASHMLIDLHNRKGQNSFLFQAIFLLEKALDKSKNNFQFKLILIRLYEALGTYLKPLELYKTMDIKHVQLDTMSHYICARSSSFAFYEEATQACYDTLPIYRNNEVETPEMIVQAYKYATFSKIQEFIQFRKELDNSMQKVLVDREVIRLEFLSVSKDLKSAMEYLERELDISDLNYDDSFCTSRYDNRDFAVIINYNSPNTKSIEEITSVSPKLDNTWLKIFSIIPQILKVMHTNNNIDDVIILIERLENLTNLEDKEVGITLEERHMGKIVAKLGRLFIIFKEVQAGQKESIEKLSKIVDEITSALKDNSTEEFSEIKVQEISWKHMHRFSTFLETCNYIIIVNKIINEMLNTKNKKSANKELIQTLQVLMTSVKENLESTKKQLTGLKEKIKDEEENLLSYIKSENKCIEFCEEEENLSFIKEILVNKVSLSWQTSIQNMIKAIEFRI
ncbi:N-acetyltransferase B complex non catalytic subunit-domain-containing protein [Glomus cerebriforme]|uniref:N-acetyltransferase B complex non catalytic subunit-domain-containing protein n=1 Tax=Glomus cerebriforme TaxID=658196 RepID=A0A397T562_9GLOM|nr:N-acetyltransferase B complex non catalytic subunit-domain-containing protein [Glomus cerebriforme]